MGRNPLFGALVVQDARPRYGTRGQFGGQVRGGTGAGGTGSAGQPLPAAARRVAVSVARSGALPPGCYAPAGTVTAAFAGALTTVVQVPLG